MKGPDIRVGLDIGTTKVCAVVAEVSSSGISILGAGLSPSTGLKKGVVVNVEATIDSIKKAVRDAESSSGVKIRTVSVGISGGHISGFESSGASGVNGSEVKANDVIRAIQSAKTVYIPLDREIIHVIPTEFVLDGQEEISNPVGMIGVRLEAKAYIITGSGSSIRNLLKCCEKAELEVANLVFAPVASAQAILTHEEKEHGVLLADIGGGTTDIALYKNGGLRHVSSVGVGGNHVTNDIALGTRVHIHEAERLKKSFGAAYSGMIEESSSVELQSGGVETRCIERKDIVQIIQPRIEEMLEMIAGDMKKCGAYEKAVSGVVFTGGASLLQGFDRYAGSVLGLPVRTGFPRNIRGLKSLGEGPMYAAGIGLVTYESEEDIYQDAERELFGGVLSRFRQWASEGVKSGINFKFYKRKEGGTLCLRSKR